IDKNEPWWEDLTPTYPNNLLDWQGNKFIEQNKSTAAHPNSRFTVSITQCPTLSKEFFNPKGVPISAIILGARRSTLIPLVYESLDWQLGVFLGAMMGSETTSAASHKVGVVRRDPMAMLPFCGYNMGDYFGHWLKILKKLKNPPKIFFVNWFRKDQYGKFLWPGFGENIRVLKWIIERIQNKIGAEETQIGYIPKFGDFELSGLNISKEQFNNLFSIDKKSWSDELEEAEAFFENFGSKMPPQLKEEFNILEKKING
ncbi:MAG: phosphoenolpyruvate carboxykinase (GTP), partial [Candidatus Omnitrophica bacterium]|nr:phosphoenolpyruvate carboxykinase (GTP) [Candidatus Omnitrophota bacterium]